MEINADAEEAGTLKISCLSVVVGVVNSCLSRMETALIEEEENACRYVHVIDNQSEHTKSQRC